MAERKIQNYRKTSLQVPAFNDAAHTFHQVFRDIKAKAGAVSLYLNWSRGRICRKGWGVPHQGTPFSVIHKFDAQAVFCELGYHVDPGIRIFVGIIQDVAENLF